MEVKRIVTGNWFPRTQLHLKEYYRFLESGTTDLPIDPEQLQVLREKLHPTEVSYVGLAEEGRFDHVDARFGEIESTYYEDGLIVVSKPVTSILDDLFHVHAFYHERFLNAVGLLYSVGLPAISVLDPAYAKRPTVFVASKATEAEAHALAETFNDAVHFTAHTARHRVYFADTLIIVVTKDVNTHLTQHLVEALMFFREFETRLNHFLNLHREIWASIEDMRDDTISFGDLPRIRDRLLDYDRDLSIVAARLAQMEQFLDERRTEIDERGFTETFRALEAYRFGKLRMTTVYIRELWNQLDDYIASTVEIVGLMYQENIQKELNIQQFIFLVGSVAGVFILGNMVTGFSLGVLAVFGGASLLMSVALFTGIRFMTSGVRRVDPVQLLGSRKPFARRESDRLRAK